VSFVVDDGALLELTHTIYFRTVRMTVNWKGLGRRRSGRIQERCRICSVRTIT
jgi:hypothetical protein